MVAADLVLQVWPLFLHNRLIRLCGGCQSCVDESAFVDFGPSF